MEVLGIILLEKAVLMYFKEQLKVSDGSQSFWFLQDSFMTNLSVLEPKSFQQTASAIS